MKGDTMNIEKPWGRARTGKPFTFYQTPDGKAVNPLPHGQLISMADTPKVAEIPTPDWMSNGDYVVYHTDEGFAATAVRDGIPHLWTTTGIDCKGNNARVMVGPDFAWDTCTPQGWIDRGVALLRDAERMFPELQWAIEWDTDGALGEGRDCSLNLKKGN
jgi:hypothetical protein